MDYKGKESQERLQERNNLGNGAIKRNKVTVNKLDLGDIKRLTAWATIRDKIPASLDHKKGTFQ